MLVVSVLEISLQANQRSMGSNVANTEWKLRSTERSQRPGGRGEIPDEV